MKKILGLDLGTNSIGWALVEEDFNEKKGKIIGIGSRIIPMSQEILGNFGKGNSVSQTADRTGFRGVRRLRERHLLRRERLHRVLNVLGFLPAHFASQIDFEKRLGKFKNDSEPKIAYKQICIENRNEHVFIFKNSFEEMLADFKENQAQLFKENNDKLIPYDWTIYYLRKKALTHKIEKEELAWLILHFNQKRGYYQLRGEEEEENPNKLIEFHTLKIVDVIADEVQKGKTDIWYSLILENGWIYRRSSKTPLFDWIGKERHFIVTTDLNDDGTIKTDKEGIEKRSFRAPSEDDWTLIKKKTEKEIAQSNETVGTYIYNTLLHNPKQKIKGQLVRTIERKFYKSELNQILNKQKEFHPELQDDNLYNECIRELYRNNDSHQILLSKKDFVHLFLDDIIFYQRPLRSQKSSISNCTLEQRHYRDKNKVKQIQYLKAIPKSNPFYQEFRLWQWIKNLSIYRIEDESNVTNEFLDTPEKIENLYAFLNERKEIEQKPLIKFFLEQRGFKGKMLNLEIEKYRWNYVNDKKYPCNETKTLISSRLAKVVNIPSLFLSSEIEHKLWHIIYSVTDKEQYERALKTFAFKYQLDETSFLGAFQKFPPFKSEYGTFSEKAIKKLLPLMRIGKYWSWEAIDSHSKKRIEKIITAEYDEKIKDRVRENTMHLENESNFQGLPLWLTQYVVYGRHSEASDVNKWNSPQDLEIFLKEFKQHSLRNPIVEQVIIETLRVVKDIWTQYGNGMKDFFNEIHIELGRDMKNTAEVRSLISKQISENENTNLRIKALLSEMIHDPSVENVRPYSPMQQEILKIYEAGVLNSDIVIDEDILKISKTAQPSSSELKRYKLWLEQKYRSPYTGEIIPLNKLFTTDYEIEHIIPQSLFFDDSMANKVICESAVNKLKDNYIGLSFIKQFHGQIIECGRGRKVKIFEVTDYEYFVKKHYAKNRNKMNKLLLEDIPEKMIERQLNDTRYISKFISSLLSNIVRDENNDDGVNSKNILPGNGKITTELKNDWGLNDVWNDLILPRFERMNQVTNSTHFTAWNENHQKFLPTVPLEFSKGFSKKRIDHRHHALDALVIACATRDHINLMNNKHAGSKIRFDLNRKLRKYEKAIFNHPQSGERIERDVPKDFIKPWPSFTVDARNALDNMVVSFKQNQRVINKATNYYEKWIEKNGKKVKEKHKQNGTNWAIRKPLHKDTVSGLVQLRKIKEVQLHVAIDNVSDIVDKILRKEIQSLLNQGFDKKAVLKHLKDKENTSEEKNLSRVEIYYWENDIVANRVSLNDTFDKKNISSLTDTGIQKILINHLKNYQGRVDEKNKEIPAQLLAFTPEGIEEMNKNIQALNEGIPHQPIYKVRKYEPKGNKFNVGNTGNKKHKYVEAAKGTNLFFAIYQDENGKRNYETIPLNTVIERQIQGLSPVPEENQIGSKLLFFLSPNDLVILKDNEEKNYYFNEIYKFIDSSGSTANFIPHSVSDILFNYTKSDQQKLGIQYPIQNEFGVGSPQSKNQKSITGIMIKEHCVKLTVDRLGNIRPYINSNSINLFGS